MRKLRRAWCLCAVISLAGCAARPTPAGPPRRPQPPAPLVTDIGRSIEGRPILLTLFQGTAPPVLIIGGIHGNEPTSALVAQKLIDHLAQFPLDARGRAVAIVAEANPDGLLARRRTNAINVDINRNFPARNWRRRKSVLFDNGPAPASEPETRAIIHLVGSLRPGRIVSIHSIDGGRQCNNYDGPAEWLAARMSELNGYPVAPTMGYPTPGSLGSWAGIDRQIPIVTLELPRRVDGEAAWRQNRDALLAAITAEPGSGAIAGDAPVGP